MQHFPVFIPRTPSKNITILSSYFILLLTVIIFLWEQSILHPVRIKATFLLRVGLFNLEIVNMSTHQERKIFKV